jgi:hypothetical protein
MNPKTTNSSATNFQIKLPLGSTRGLKAIPTALKKATTHPVHPNVSNPNINVNKGIALLPLGSTLVSL